MAAKNLKDYAESIKRTGFELEYKVTSLLKKHSWSVINNRYYVDDITNVVREVDIIAYKVVEKAQCRLYTTLIISCKKSDENIWAFLTKDLEPSDPNIELYPIHNWTNSKALTHLFSKKNWNEAYKNKISEDPQLKSIYETDRQIFAFQEMKKSNHSPNDDKAIFGSLTSLIKAYAFETANLKKRAKEECIYNFNLISVVDSDLIELQFSDSGILGKNLDDIKYLNRHIVFNKDEFYRVHFVAFQKFEELLKSYDYLWDWNHNYYSKEISSFYANIFTEWSARQVHIKDLSNNILWWINHHIRSQTEEEAKAKISDITLSKDRKTAIIELYSASDKACDSLNGDKNVKIAAKGAIKKYYRTNVDAVQFNSGDLPF